MFVQGLQAEEAVTVGTGKMKLGALMQGWAVDDTTAPNNADLNFRLRRAEFKATGSVHPDSRYFIMIDAAKNPSSTGDNKILQDFGAAFMIFENFEVIAGQFKIPTTDEGLRSSTELLFPERSYFARTFGDRREAGVMLDYNGKPVRVRVMASNGQASPGAVSTNVNEVDSSKDVNGRVDWTIIEGLKLAAFGSNSQSVVGNSLRTGGDIEYTCPKMLVRVAGVSAKEIGIEKTGMVADVGYNLTEKLQAVARFENYQVTTAPKSSARATSLGLNYMFEGNNLKLQLAHTMMNHFTSVGGTPSAYVDGTYKLGSNNAGSLTVLSLQTTL